MSAEKLDFSKPEELQTRDGRAVRIYATDGVGAWPIHGAVSHWSDGWGIESWAADGLVGGSRDHSPSDLVRKPQRVTGWVNIYRSSIGTIAYPSREAAIEAATSYCRGQIYVDAEIQS